MCICVVSLLSDHLSLIPFDASALNLLKTGSYHQLGPICAPDVVYLSDYKKGWVVVEQIMTLSTYIIYVLSFSINFVYIWQMDYSSRVKVWEVWSHKQVIEVYELTKIWLCFPLFLNSVRAWVLDLRYWVQMLPLPYFPICNTNRIWIFINNNWKKKKTSVTDSCSIALWCL